MCPAEGGRERERARPEGGCGCECERAPPRVNVGVSVCVLAQGGPECGLRARTWALRRGALGARLSAPALGPPSRSCSPLGRFPVVGVV